MRDPPSISLGCPNLKSKIGSRRQELLDRLSDYDYMTPYRRASMKRYGQTARWLTESAEFADWMADPKSSIFILSGKRESFLREDQCLIYGLIFVQLGLARP